MEDLETQPDGLEIQAADMEAQPDTAELEPAQENAQENAEESTQDAAQEVAEETAHEPPQTISIEEWMAAASQASAEDAPKPAALEDVQLLAVLEACVYVVEEPLMPA